jgi:hypothetical protein
MTSQSFFKWTVAVLAIPAVILSALVVLDICLMLLGRWTGGIGSVAFGFSISKAAVTMTLGAMLFGIIILVFAVGRLIRRP